MKKNYLFAVLVLLNGIFLSLWTLSCRKNSGEGNTLEPKEWFEAYVELDSFANNWRQNHVKNIDWEKSVKVKDAFDNEAWEIPVESKMYFGYEHTITNVNGKEVAIVDQLKSVRIISPFKVHLLITKNKAEKFDGRILNYFAPSSDATKQYPNNLNQLPDYSDLGISISEFSGKPDYSLYYGDNGLRSFGTPSLEKSEVLKAKFPMTDRAKLGVFTVITNWYQNNLGGDDSTAWVYTNSTSQYYINYFPLPIPNSNELPPIPAEGTGGGYGGSTVTTHWVNNNLWFVESLPDDPDENNE